MRRRRGISRRALAFGLLAAVFGLPAEPASAGQDGDAAATVYLVRHAEKEQVAGPDPPLTAAGARRARALAELLADAPVTAVIASEFLRTQQTVGPLAERLGLEVEVVDAAAGDALAERLRATAPGTAVAVAGHSNTVPALIAALGVAETVEIPEERYGDLFVVRLSEDGATLERSTFGDP